MATIRNPIEWGSDQLRRATTHVESAGRSVRGTEAEARRHLPAVRKIGLADLREALAKGLDDLGAYRTDVIFLCVVYPLAGLVLARIALNEDMMPLLFPLASGFALIGPAAAVGLYEMSRRREQGAVSSWASAFGVVRSPSFGPILLLGLALLVIFVLWLGAAQLIYWGTLGPDSPASFSAFAQDVLTTPEGWAMIVIGVGVGFLFALLVLAISVVSFPLLLDHDVGVSVAVRTSVKVMLTNPRTIAAWGLIVAGGLVLGSIPLFLGLIIIMPVLGHATWHLYRKTVAW